MVLHPLPYITINIVYPHGSGRVHVNRLCVRAEYLIDMLDQVDLAYSR